MDNDRFNGLTGYLRIYAGYWILSIAAIIVLLILPYLHFAHQARILRTTIFAIILGLFIAKLIAALFFFIDDIRRGIQWATGKFFSRDTTGENLQEGEGISRSVFLSWAGMIAGGGLFATLMNGFGNKYQYQVKKVPLAYSNLPEAFKGLKIVHISDIHSGSLMDKRAVLKGVEKILQEKPDLILFTGDLVNNTANEMEGYMDVFSKLNAPLGVYSTLGNHDYGDYVEWGTTEEKNANLERLKQVHAEMGWRLLMNEHSHGMQFGVELPGFKWSPVQYVYEQWAGLYEKEAQKLYVNRGYGFIGYPGRVGILPEITVLELS